MELICARLRIFYMLMCIIYWRIYGNCDEYVDGTTNKLKEIVNMYNSHRKLDDLDIHDLTSVCGLTDLHLDMHSVAGAPENRFPSLSGTRDS